LDVVRHKSKKSIREVKNVIVGEQRRSDTELKGANFLWKSLKRRNSFGENCVQIMIEA
jgi:hypothetical protein